MSKNFCLTSTTTDLNSVSSNTPRFLKHVGFSGLSAAAEIASQAHSQVVDRIQNLENSIGVGYTASKKIGNAVKRNKAKRILRELARKIIINGKTNSYYVLIAKSSLLEEKFDKLLMELKEKIND